MASNHTSVATTIRVDAEQVEQITRELHAIPRGVPKALQGGINKTLAKAKTTLVNGLTELLTAKRGNILGKGQTKRITTIRATNSRPVGTLRILSRKIGLINFKLTDTRQKVPARGGIGKRVLKKLGAESGSGRGVVAQIRKDEAPIVFPKAFVAVGLSDNRHVFERFGVGIGGKGRGGKHRQEKAHYKPNIGRLTESIRSLKGISLHDVWRDSPRLRRKVNARIAAELPREIASQVDFLLGRSKNAPPP